MQSCNIFHWASNFAVPDYNFTESLNCVSAQNKEKVKYTVVLQHMHVLLFSANTVKNHVCMECVNSLLSKRATLQTTKEQNVDTLGWF